MSSARWRSSHGRSRVPSTGTRGRRLARGLGTWRVHVEYECTDLYDRGGEVLIAWNGPEMGIDWPVKELLLSAKDAGAPRLSEILDRLRALAP